MPSAKQILKQLQAEVDEARDALVHAVLTTADLPMAIDQAASDYSEKQSRLDKAKGAS
jgi:hypothetical protein